MALTKSTIKSSIFSMLSDNFSKTSDPMAALDACSDQFADIIIAAIKSADIRYTSGLTAPNGPVTGTFNGSLE